MNKKVYISSKIRHRNMWLKLREFGIPFNSRWLDYHLDSPPTGKVWQDFIEDIRECNSLLCVAENDDDLEKMKGCLIEVGIALELGKWVYYYGPVTNARHGVLIDNDMVHICPTLRNAIHWSCSNQVSTSHIPEKYFMFPDELNDRT